jgi:NitT/TauT family transport system substrate-binding protein
MRARLISLLRLVACASVCLLAAGAASAQAGLVTVRVASTPDDALMPVLYAQRTGRFRAVGLDVQIEKANGGAAIAAGVAGGAYDIGKSALLSLFSAHERGLGFTLVAPGGISDAATPYGFLIVAKDAAIRSARDLNGKIASCSALQSLDEITLRQWVDQNGGDSSTMKFVEMPMTESGAALEAHRIDAALVIHPQVDAALAGGKVRILARAFTAIAPRYFVSAWFSDGEWATKHADVVARFARVVRESAAYANTHHAETAPLLADFSGIPLPVVQQMARATYGTVLDPALLQPVIDTAKRYGVLKRGFPAPEIVFSPPAAPR